MRCVNKKLKGGAKENGAHLGEDGMRSESKLFYELLMITFSSKKEQYEELKLHYKQILNNNESEMWGDFEKKIDMLIEELACYLEITDDLNLLEGFYKENRKHYDSLKKKLTELQNSRTETVGFFNKTPKSDKIIEYKAEIKKAEESNASLNTIINILSQVIIKNEIEVIKERKKQRYESAIKTFSQRKLKSLEDCLQFWHCINEDSESLKIMESHFNENHG